MTARDLYTMPFYPRDTIMRALLTHGHPGVWMLLLGMTALVLAALARSRRRPDAARNGPQPLTIEALRDFDWRATEPRKIRPIKPVYHITMALQSDTPSDLIVIDKNYLDRVSLRRDLVRRHQDTVLGCLPSGEDAVGEVYSYLLGEYLPTRYPTMFRLSRDGKTFSNLVTGKEFPAAAGSGDTRGALGILAETVEEDMFILHQTPDGHFTDAYVCCFPSGFDPSEKLGKLLRQVHGPVPSYDKIAASMERFFGRVEVGKSVKRTNWSIQTNDVLFNCKPHVDPHAKPELDFSIDDTYFRVELQTLTRLPRTRHVLFSFKTYLYPLREIKEEGMGPDLAAAIGGIGSGNAPGMRKYKGAERWGERVREYLLS